MPTSIRWRAALGVLAVVTGAAACSSGGSDPERVAPQGADTTEGSTSTAAATTTTVDPARVTDLVLDPDGDYGDEYADGILPVGDGQYSTEGAQVGVPYLCRAQTGGGGAFQRGPWFVNGDTEYDINLKVAVEGAVTWPGTLTTTIEGGERVVATNAVPGDHTTGEFPVQPSDPAAQYDPNPNSITELALTYRLPASPTVLDAPTCMGGEAGIMLTGVPLFNAFDAAGRDAGAWETQDSCNGHPQEQGEYHYHTLSSCIADTSVATVIGFALDGFPITGPKVSEGSILTTADLDECHGITSTIELDGEQVTTYHYVMTQDFPYSVSCFRGTAIMPPRAG